MIAIARMLGGVASSALPWRWILGGLAAIAAVGAWAYVSGLRADNARLRQDLVVLEGAADQNRQAVLATIEYANEAVAAMAEERDEYARRVARITAIRSEVDHAPPSDDAPVAPVLGLVLDRLWRGAEDGAGGAGGKTEGPARPAGVPADSASGGP